MGRLTHDEFFTQLTTLFASRKGKDHGGVLLTQKRFTPKDTPKDTPATLTTPIEPQTLLIRATDAKSREKRPERIKLSTLVEPHELDTFYARYAEVCKSGMGGLKPRDRTKRKAKAKKKKGGA